MAFLGRSNFQRNRDFLLGQDGREDEPGDEFQTAPTVGAGGASTSTSPSSQTQDESTTFEAPSASPVTPPAAEQEPPSAPTLKSFTRSGTLSERLFAPASEAAAAGGETLSEASDLFQEEAGPSRTFESTGAEGTLREAYQGGRDEDMERARGFVGARYEGPGGLDQGTVAGLQTLTGDLRTRQRALSSAGGLQTLIGQSVGGLTPGESLFEAKRELPAAKTRARDIGFQEIAPLEGRIANERQQALDFGAQRLAEEEDIAGRSRGFLEGERGGVSGDLEALIAERAAQQSGASEALAAIQGEEDPGARLGLIQSAAPYLQEGTREEPGEAAGQDVADLFNTQAIQDKAAADELFAQIMARPEFASISEFDPLELGVTQRGKPFYDAPDAEGNLADVRDVHTDPAVQQLLFDRQRALEEPFDPARGQGRVTSTTPGEESPYANLRPLYYGDEAGGDFQALDQRGYLGFDPGVRPSRENTSTEVQRSQFNRLNDLLGELDRIEEGGDEYRAAQIFAEAERYVEDEAAALEERGENLSKANKEWANHVYRLRKSYRKKKRQKKYAKIGSVMGAVPGGDLSGAAISAGISGSP